MDLEGLGLGLVQPCYRIRSTKEGWPRVEYTQSTCFQIRSSQPRNICLLHVVSAERHLSIAAAVVVVTFVAVFVVVGGAEVNGSA